MAKAVADTPLTLTYAQAVETLGQMQRRGWRLGLDRMVEFARRLGLQDHLGHSGSPKFLHVAGTNGKGSVTSFLQSLLIEQGYRTGAYYSPYVYTVRERVQMGRGLIGKEDFARIVGALLPAANALEATRLGGPTEFEFKTAVGLAYWAEQQAEAVALEVGLGGRLDATNIVEPAACVVASIGFDHMNVLGDTLEKIATEKAGIIKKGKPVIVGEMPEPARDTILAIAAKRKAPAWRIGHEVTYGLGPAGLEVVTPEGTFSGLRPSLFGVKQEHNLACAIGALVAAGMVRDAEAVAVGASSARLPGRFEVRPWHGRTLILDGAHNPDSAEVTVRSLFEFDVPEARQLRLANPSEYRKRLNAWVDESKDHPRVTLVSGMLSGHEPRAFYAPLASIARSVHLAPINFHRTRDPLELLAELGDTFQVAVAHRSLAGAMQGALEDTKEGDTVLVCGSFHLVGEVGRHLGRTR